jgi:glycosidase
VVHGDYRRWIDQGGIASTTNYETYKGLWSSHNDRNYFEIAYSLKRQFGEEGIYRGLPLYAFADNHDVDRVASILKEPAHLGPLYAILLTTPGVPSIYYGSECGIEGRKGKATDAPLRPALDPVSMLQNAPHPELRKTIKTLIGLRRRHSALVRGEYAQLHVAHEQFAFLRRDQDESIVVAVNASDRPIDLALRLPAFNHAQLIDELNGDEKFTVSGGKCTLPMSQRGARVLIAR